MAKINTKYLYFYNHLVKKNPPLKCYLKKYFIITNHLVGKSFLIYNGKTFIERKITQQMVGLKFGELLFTRAFFEHKRTKNKKSAKKRR